MADKRHSGPGPQHSWVEADGKPTTEFARFIDKLARKIDLTSDVDGNLPVGNLDSGTNASTSTYWRGDGSWNTPSGAGNVSNTGTPVDNQLAIWTGETIIEGDSGITWNGSIFNVTGDMTISGTVDGRDISADGDTLDGLTSAGYVSRTGTPLNNQIAIFTDVDTVEGVTAVTWDGTTFALTGDLNVSSGNDASFAISKNASDTAWQGYTVFNSGMTSGQYVQLQVGQSAATASCYEFNYYYHSTAANNYFDLGFYGRRGISYNYDGAAKVYGGLTIGSTRSTTPNGLQTSGLLVDEGGIVLTSGDLDVDGDDINVTAGSINVSSGLDGAIAVTKSAADTYWQGFTVFNSGMSSGNSTQFLFGQAGSGLNCCEFNYFYRGSSFASNYFDLGFYGRRGLSINGSGAAKINGGLTIGSTRSGAPDGLQTSGLLVDEGGIALTDGDIDVSGGDISIDRTGDASDASLSLEGGSANGTNVILRRATAGAGDIVWNINSASSISDNVRFMRYNAGVYVDDPLTINNTTGDVDIANDLDVTGDVIIGGYTFSDSGTNLVLTDDSSVDTIAFSGAGVGHYNEWVLATGTGLTGSYPGLRMSSTAMLSWNSAGGYLTTPDTFIIPTGVGTVGISTDGSTADGTLEAGDITSTGDLLVDRTGQVTDAQITLMSDNLQDNIIYMGESVNSGGSIAYDGNANTVDIRTRNSGVDANAISVDRISGDVTIANDLDVTGDISGAAGTLTGGLDVSGGNVDLFPSDNTRFLTFYNSNYYVTASSGLELGSGNSVNIDILGTREYAFDATQADFKSNDITTTGDITATGGASTITADNMRIGDWISNTDYACISHTSQFDNNVGFAMLQASAGSVFINAPTGATLNFRINNASGTTFDGTEWDFGASDITTTGDLSANAADFTSIVEIDRNAVSGTYYSAADDFIIATSADAGMTIRSGSTNYGAMAFADGDTGNEQYRGMFRYNHLTDQMEIFVAGGLQLDISSTTFDFYDNDITTTGTISATDANLSDLPTPTNYTAADDDVVTHLAGIDTALGDIEAGDVDISGTPANNQLAVCTDASTIEGDSSLTWDGSALDVGSSSVTSGQVNIKGNTTGSIHLYDTGSGEVQGSDDLLILKLSAQAYVRNESSGGLYLGNAGATMLELSGTTADFQDNDITTTGSITTTASDSGGSLHLGGGDNATAANGSFQVSLNYNGNEFPEYPHFISSRHNSATGPGNAIEFWTCDGSQNGAFATNKVFGMQVANGHVQIGGTPQQDSSDLPYELDVQGTANFDGAVTVGSTVDGVDIASRDGDLTTAESKLAGIEALADVTDATNVAAAGAAMDGGAHHDGFSDYVANEHIDWTSTSSSISTTGDIACDDFTMGNAQCISIARTLGTTSGDTIELGTITATGAIMFELWVTAANGSWDVAQMWRLASRKNSTGTSWAGTYAQEHLDTLSSTNDYRLDVKHNATVMTLRLRRTGGATSTSLKCFLRILGDTTDATWASSSTTAAGVSAPGSTHEGCAWGVNQSDPSFKTWYPLWAQDEIVLKTTTAAGGLQFGGTSGGTGEYMYGDGAGDIFFGQAGADTAKFGASAFRAITDSAISLGTTGVRWSDLYVDAATVGGNITVGGTVDGRDVAADGDTLDALSGSTLVAGGTPAATEIGVYTDATTIDSYSNFTWNNSTTLLSVNGDIALTGTNDWIGWDNGDESIRWDGSKLNFYNAGVDAITMGASTFRPSTDGAYDLGNATYRWGDVHADAATIAGNISVTGTVDGVDIAARDGDLTTAESKLAGIEALADVTDATNVAAAGAAMSGGAFHDGFSDFVANEHIDWTSTSSNLDTSGTVTAATVTADTTGFSAGSATAASTTDLSKHLRLWGTTYGINVTSGNVNLVANSQNTLSSTSTQLTSRVNHDFASGIDVTGSTTLGFTTISLAGTGGYVKPFLAYAPDITEGQRMQFGWGKANTTNSQAEFNFQYNAAGSSVHLGIYGQPSIIGFYSGRGFSVVDWTPYTNGASDLGNTSYRWGDVHADAATITGNISVTGTVDGVDIAARDANLTTAESKLAGIEALADVTDATNVAAAGAAMSGGAFHDGFSDYVANEHIDWTSTSSSLVTTGSISGGDITATANMYVGVDDTTAGRLDIYGGATGQEGGEIRLYRGADDDTTYQFWAIDADGEGDFRIFRSDGGGESISIDQSSGDVSIPGSRNLDVTGSITVTGTVDGVDIATRDGNLTTAESDITTLQTTVADLPVGNLADGTDGELITWSAAGAPTTVAVGTAGQALVSNGAGAAPTFQTVAGSGDVVKVGTPVNNEIGVWTGDGTIEGDTNLQYDATDLTVAGDRVNWTFTAEVICNSTTETIGSLPAGIQEFYLIFEDVSSDGTNDMYIRLGDSGGLEATGYVADCIEVDATPTVQSSTTEFRLEASNAGRAMTGHLHFIHKGSNHWVMSGVVASGTKMVMTAGDKTLSGELTQVGILLNGDTYDGGTIQIMYR